MTETSTPKEKKLLNVTEAAELYGADPETIRRWARTGTIPGFKVGKGRNAPYRFRRTALEADMTRREKAMAAGRVA